MLRCRSRRKRAPVILTHIKLAKLSEIFFTGDSTWFSIKFTSELCAIVTPYVPGHIFLLFCQGGAIRTIDSSDIDIFVHLAGVPGTKNVMTCQLSACVVRVLQTIRRNTIHTPPLRQGLVRQHLLIQCCFSGVYFSPPYSNIERIF